MNKHITFSEYKKLLIKIRSFIEHGEARARKAAEREKIVTCWHIGKSIDIHLTTDKRADYGVYLFNQLSSDLGIGKSGLYNMHAFFKAYPKLPDKNNLSWSHYKVLSRVKDVESRNKLEHISVEQKWSQRILEQQVRKDLQKITLTKKSKKNKISLNRGILYTYKSVTSKFIDSTLIDCGFNIFKESDRKLSFGDFVVRSFKIKDSYDVKRAKINLKKLYTYKAYIEKVVDGDTLCVVIDLGFKIYHRQCVRLRGIDAPEMDSLEGKRAARYIKHIVKDLQFIVLKTYEQDKYGRYLADVFYLKDEEDINIVACKGVFLNQKLFTEGMADILV
ncbi:DUF1016 N-terminal domain-containing protein [bacterium]